MLTIIVFNIIAGLFLRYWNAENGLSPAKKFFHLGFVLGIGVPLFCASLVGFSLLRVQFCFIFSSAFSFVLVFCFV